MAPTNDFDGVINPPAEWGDVPQLSTEARALGGETNPMNAQAVALAKQTRYLKEEIENKEQIYKAGVRITSYNQLVLFQGDNQLYRLVPSVPLPYIIEGNWKTEKDKFYTMNQTHFAEDYANRAKESEVKAEASKNAAKISEDNAKESEENAAESEETALKTIPIHSDTPPIQPLPNVDWINTVTGQRFTNMGTMEEPVWVEVAAAMVVDNATQVSLLRSELGSDTGSELVGFKNETVQEVLEEHSDKLSNVEGNLNFTTLPSAITPADDNLFLIRQGTENKKVSLGVVKAELSAEVNEAKEAAETARDAAFVNADVYADTTAGLSATVDGEQFQVVDGLEIVRYRNDSGVATQVAAYPSASIDSLMVNVGKPFPLKPMVRDGVLASAGARNYNDFLLDARVEGSSRSIEGYYFRIAYFQNDVTVGGNTHKGVMIQRLPIATYSTASEPEIIHHYVDTPIEFDRDSGVQTVTIRPERTPEPISIHLTIDTDRVYPAGQFIDSRNPNNPSGSWIIDTSCYVVNEPVGYDALTVNRGKPYPLKQMNLGGVVSDENKAWSDLILDVEVLGAEPGKYYQISYYQNGVVVGGSPGYGWIIRERDADGLESNTSDGVRIEDRQQLAELIDRNGGIQTIRIVPTHRPNMTFKITVDAAELPPEGDFINSNDNSRNGWSWVIDPSCYTYSAAEPNTFNSLTVNSGKPYPLSQITLGGVTSGENKRWSDLILAAEVIGAERGKVYQLAFYQNGAVVGGSPGYGWIIREHDASDPDNIVEGPRIENLEQIEEIIDRAGGVQTIRIVPTHRPEMEFKLTIDADQLPPDGTSINSNNDFRDGWSWVIDPSCYTYPQPVSVTNESQAGVAWEVSGGDLAVTYPSNGHYYRITFGPNGFNNLPNFKRVETSSDGASWTSLMNFTTDWLPPITLAAVNNGDGGEAIYTGGNHGSSGGAGGEQTARNIHYVVAPDGRPVTTDDSGQADEVVVTVVNEVMAYNTITLGRYVLRETFKLTFYAGGCSVTAVRVPYEALTLGNDNGLQATTTTFVNVGTYMIYGGQQGRAVFDENRVGAGNTTTSPNAWATVFQEPSAGQFVVWMDRNFGVGAGTFNPSTYVRFGGGSNTKIYNNVAGFGDTPLAAGEAYTWRGGYAWMMPEELNSLDSMFLYRNAGEAKVAYAVDNQDWWTM